MVALDALGAAELCQVIVTFRDGLRSHQEVINRLNVYPVPDGDTGTNMALTLESVTDELAGLDAPDLGATCKAIAHGSLMGARGNSGVILSQLLRGICRGSRRLARAPRRRCAVRGTGHGRPSGPGGGHAPGRRHHPDRGPGRRRGSPVPPPTTGESLVAVAEASRAGAAEALARTPSLLPVLAQAGVVDAGGAGYLLLFDALLTVLDGRPMPAPPSCRPPFARAIPRPPGLRRRHRPEARRTNLAGLRYEVMYLLEAPDATIPSFKEVWAGLGDSIVVVGGDGLWNCHIHTDDIGAAIEASLDAGRPRNVRVTDLLEQVEEERWVREGAATAGSGPSETPPGRHRPPGWWLWPPATASGRIFRSLGVQRLIAGGQSMNPSIAELVEAVDALRSDQVIILPNNGNIRPVAERVDDLTTKRVWVVPTETITEGFAALLAYDPEAEGEVNARDDGGVGGQGGSRRGDPGRA